MNDPKESSPPPGATGSEPEPAAGGRGVNRLGYRGWSGRLAPAATRWAVISGVGVRRAWQSLWVKRLLLLAWLPALWFGIGFFLWEQAALYPEWRQMLTPFLSMLPATHEYDVIRNAVRGGDLESERHSMWAWLLQTFFRYPQGVLMVLIVGLIAPPLISQDIRSRAFLLYFSRPLTRSEYLLGKLAGVWVYLLLISTAPALVLYVLGVMLSPNLGVFAATWDLPLRILVASAVLMIPTSVLALCMSSLTQESRYAGFGWFALWIMGWFTYRAVTAAEDYNTQAQFANQGRVVAAAESSWTHVSLYHTLGRVQNWVFGFSDFSEVMTSTAILVGVTVVSLAILYRRISAPMRI